MGTLYIVFRKLVYSIYETNHFGNRAPLSHFFYGSSQVSLADYYYREMQIEMAHQFLSTLQLQL